MPSLSGDDFHGEIYDAIWTMALALRELQLDYDRRANASLAKRQSLADFNYARNDMAEELMRKISSLRFQGASGLVSFAGADRIGTTALFQIQGKRKPIFGMRSPKCPNFKSARDPDESRLERE